MRRGKVSLTELPNVNNITIEHQLFGLYTIKIGNELIGMTAVGSKVDIRDYDQFNLSLLQYKIVYLQNKAVGINLKSTLNEVFVRFGLRKDER